MIYLTACNQPSEYISSTDGMILIPAGEFIMGTDVQGANPNQNPAHAVYLDAFYIDKYEITNSQFADFISAGGYSNRKFWTREGWRFIKNNQIETPLYFGQNKISTEPNQPVIGVSWHEANAYAKWAGKRLPTEAEWEKAARGTDQRLYPWGSKMDFLRLNYFPHGTKLFAVGSYPSGASAYGIMDMAGSVWEWTADWYSASYYKQSPETNPKGPANGEYRVLRGGAWDSIRAQLQCTYRHYEKVSRPSYTLGFRCADDVPK